MPELPEVEVLVRHLAPLLQGRRIRKVEVHRPRVLRPTSRRQLSRILIGATFSSVKRRGKFLLLTLKKARPSQTVMLVGHLGMTGRMYLLPGGGPLPKHAAVVLDLGQERFVFEDTRYFGRFTLDATLLQKLGPEPLSADFTPEVFSQALQLSRQPIKVKLLDQSLVAGLGNIYASEALFRAGISPMLSARKLGANQVRQLWQAIRTVLSEAIDCGSTVPLNFAATNEQDGFFYFGREQGVPDSYEERLRVYDRSGEPCLVCGTVVKRLVQAARSTFYCPSCQRTKTERKVPKKRSSNVDRYPP